MLCIRIRQVKKVPFLTGYGTLFTLSKSYAFFAGKALPGEEGGPPVRGGICPVREPAGADRLLRAPPAVQQGAAQAPRHGGAAAPEAGRSLLLPHQWGNILQVGA